MSTGMKKLLPLLLISFCFFSWSKAPANFFVGTWKSYRLEQYSKKNTLPAETVKRFTSEITFFPDSTFIKTTNGEETRGKYRRKENKLVFYDVSRDGGLQVAFNISWGVDEKDPMPSTPEIDFVYPELVKVKNKKGKLVDGFADVYYIRTN